MESTKRSPVSGVHKNDAKIFAGLKNTGKMLKEPSNLSTLCVESKLKSRSYFEENSEADGPSDARSRNSALTRKFQHHKNPSSDSSKLSRQKDSFYHQQTFSTSQRIGQEITSEAQRALKMIGVHMSQQRRQPTSNLVQKPTVEKENLRPSEQESTSNLDTEKAHSA